MIILDSVPRLNHVDILEAGNRLEQLELVLGGECDRDAVRVDEVWK